MRDHHEVARPGDRIAFTDAGLRAHAVAESSVGLRAVILERDRNDQRHAETLPVEQGDLGADHARLAKPVETPAHRGLGQMDGLRNLGVGPAVVGLNEAQDLPIEIVEFHPETFAHALRPRQRNSSCK